MTNSSETSILDLNRKLNKLNKTSMVAVMDNWHGCYPGGNIKFSITAYCEESNKEDGVFKWRISLLASGNDDFFMVRTHKFNGTVARFTIIYKELLEQYNKIISDDHYKDKYYFEDLGFERG